MKDHSLNLVADFAKPELCWAKPFVYNEDVVGDVSLKYFHYPYSSQMGGFSSLEAPHVGCHYKANVKVSSFCEPATHICSLQLLAFPKSQHNGLGSLVPADG